MAMKQLGTQAFGFNDDFVYNYLPTMIQEAKTKGGSGSSAATALRSMLNLMLGGVGMRKSALPVWEEMGLINPNGVVKNSTGSFQLKPGALKDAAMVSSNPEEWAMKYSGVISGYAAKHHLNLQQTVMAMSGNARVQWALMTLLAKQPQFARDKALVEGSGRTSIETYQKLAKTNPQLAEEALHAQWQNILSILGYQILPRILPLMVKFATGLDNISQWMARHPNLTQGLVIGLGGLAVSLSVLGKVMMMAGLIKFLGIGPVILAALTPLGLAAAAITAIGFAGYELYKHWGMGQREVRSRRRVERQRRPLRWPQRRLGR
jgi:hypothetical protein